MIKFREGFYRLVCDPCSKEYGVGYAYKRDVVDLRIKIDDWVCRDYKGYHEDLCPECVKEMGVCRKCEQASIGGSGTVIMSNLEELEKENGYGGATQRGSGKIEVIQPLPKEGGGGGGTPGKGSGGTGGTPPVCSGIGGKGGSPMTLDDFIKMAHEITLKLGGKTITYATAHSWGMGESIKLHFTDDTMVEIYPEHDEGFKFDFCDSEESE